MLTISQARKSENQVMQTKVVARARNTVPQPWSMELLQPTPKEPSPKPKSTMEKAERQRAAIQRP